MPFLFKRSKESSLKTKVYPLFYECEISSYNCLLNKIKSNRLFLNIDIHKYLKENS